MNLYFYAVILFCRLFIKPACDAELTGRGADKAACLPILDLCLAGFEGGGDDMPIPAFDGP